MSSKLNFSYLPDCPYYQEFEPQFMNVTNYLCGEVSVGQIDVSKYKGTKRTS